MTLGKIGVVVASRTWSSRLPGKALLPVQGIPMTLFLLRRLRALTTGKLILATTDLKSDDELAALAGSDGFTVFRGEESDVVSRYVRVARDFELDTVVRVTGDCPFVDATLVDWCLARASEFGHFDLATTKGRFPVGLDAEIYRAECMADLHARRDLSPADREHLTLFLYQHNEEFVVRRIPGPANWPPTECQFTVDTADDYAFAQRLASEFDRFDFSIDALLARVMDQSAAAVASRSAG